MNIVVIVLNYNSFKLTIENVNIILNSNKWMDGLLNIVIVDNCSTDDSFSYLTEYYKDCDEVHVVQTEYNSGYANGNNYGIQYAIKTMENIKYITIMNPDAICCEENLLIKMAKALDTDNHIAWIAPVMIEPDSGDYCIKMYNNGWKVPTYFDIVIKNIPFMKRVFRWNDRYKKVVLSDNLELAYVDVVHGSFFMIRADVLEKIGFFDNNTFLYYEENILAQKLLAQGYSAAILLKSSYVHQHDMSKIKKEAQKNKDRIMKQSTIYYVETILKKGKLSQWFLRFVWFINRI